MSAGLENEVMQDLSGSNPDSACRERNRCETTVFLSVNGPNRIQQSALRY